MGVVCYPSPNKRKGLIINSEFAKGCGGRIATKSEEPADPSTASFFYGWTDYTIPRIRACLEHGLPWLYADNGYMKFGHYYRVTRDDWMHSGDGLSDGRRLARLKIDIKPWRPDGSHIVVVTQSEHYYRERLGVSRGMWTRRLVDRLREMTVREIRVRDKPDGKFLKRHIGPNATFADDLDGAWAVVSHSSSAMVDAIIAGVPVFSIGHSMASSMGRDDLDWIEDPFYPVDRGRWLSVLADNQWTLDEMRDGTCWRMLNPG